MTGEREGNRCCPLCRRRLQTGQATKVTDQIVSLLNEEASNEALVWSAMKASEAAFARVWDNEEDAVYDHL